MSDVDLTSLLDSWRYEGGRINARHIEGDDGRPKLQIRLDLGILQMEMEGRPDGAEPHGQPSLLEHHLLRMEHYTRQAGTSHGYVLSSDECRALREEALQFYHRYVGLFAIGDYSGVIRDAGRNLKVFDLCRDYGQTEADRAIMEQFRPQVITMLTRSAAELAISLARPKEALSALDKGLEQLRRVFDDAGVGNTYDTANEVVLLRGMRDTLVPKLPASQRSEIIERIQAAIDAENFELAAILRDELRMMKD